MFRYDYEKLCGSVQDVIQGLQSRLLQWQDYENQYDKIVAWLTETEANLKSFGPKASLEEKSDQLEKFQV